MKVLVGYTGFVGSNIFASGSFDAVFNSKNIEDAYGLNPDLLIYAGLKAEKYLANSAPEKDMELIKQAEENIRRINPKKLVLISTIDVFTVPKEVDETADIDTNKLAPYGYNRYQLECWVREHYPDSLIIRLPGLFGKNIKKNFIYDYINIIPFMLKEDKYNELVSIKPELRKYYQSQNNGFYRVIELEHAEKTVLKGLFRDLGFSALNFTDSRSKYQFYPLSRLWNDIQILIRNDIQMWHPATEPISASELYYYMTGENFQNELPGIPADYDYKTIHSQLFGGNNGYICGKNEILKSIKAFIQQSQ